MTHNMITNQPPLVVFIICLTAFGCTMIVLAYVVGEQEVPNPDVQMDWNKFFKKMSNLNLCLLQNYTKTKDGLIAINSKPEAPLNASASRVVDESKSLSAVLSNVVDSAMHENSRESTFVETSVKVKFGLSGKLAHESHFNLKGKLRGNLLGFSGKNAFTLFNISLSFRSTENTTCNGDKCISVFEVCISMNLPLEVLPKTKAPDGCSSKELPVQDLLPIIFSEDPLSTSKHSSSCIELEYTPDPGLTEMLSLHDRSIVNLHLMHTSYFMFVMVMTLVCFSLIRGRYRVTIPPKSYHSLPKGPPNT